MTGETKLEPCPFCEWPLYSGTLDDGSCCVKEDMSGNFWVECPDCCAQGPLTNSRVEAIATWKTRTPDLQSKLDRATDALEIVDSWLERWAAHVGNCSGGAQCTCGLERVRYDASATLAFIKDQQ